MSQDTATLECDLLIDAISCDTERGVKVGTVVLSSSQHEMVFEVDNDSWSLAQVQVYYGEKKLPQKDGKWVTNPMDYSVQQRFEEPVGSVSVDYEASLFEHGHFLIAHATVCSTESNHKQPLLTG